MPKKAKKLKTTLKPIGRRSLVKPETPVQAGLIIIPDSATPKPQYGEIIATGSKLVTVGETVFFRKYAGTPVEVKGVTCLVVPEEELLATAEGRTS